MSLSFNDIGIDFTAIKKSCSFRLLDLKGQIDSLAKEYTANARTISSEQKLSILRQIQQSYSKCKEFGDDKVQLAMQTYEMVSIKYDTSLIYTFTLLFYHTQSLSSVFYRLTNTSGVLTPTWLGLKLT